MKFVCLDNVPGLTHLLKQKKNFTVSCRTVTNVKLWGSALSFLIMSKSHMWVDIAMISSSLMTYITGNFARRLLSHWLLIIMMCNLDYVICDSVYVTDDIWSVEIINDYYRVPTPTGKSWIFPKISTTWKVLEIEV